VGDRYAAAEPMRDARSLERPGEPAAMPDASATQTPAAAPMPVPAPPAAAAKPAGRPAASAKRRALPLPVTPAFDAADMSGSHGGGPATTNGTGTAPSDIPSSWK